MRKVVIIVLWIIIILIPVAAVSSQIDNDLSLINYLISKEWAHVIAHMVIFFSLAFLVNWALHKRPTWIQITVPFLIIFLVGLSQEAIQLIYKHRAFGYPEIFDLFVDLGGGFSGVVFFQISAHFSQRLKDVFTPQEPARVQRPDNRVHNLHQ